MDALAVTILVDSDGAGSREILSSRRSDFRFIVAADFNGIRWLVVKPTVETIVAIRTNAGCRMD